MNDFLRRTLPILLAVPLLTGMVLVCRWPAIVGYGVRQDLDDYASQVRQSHLSLNEKLALLDCIDAVEDQLPQMRPGLMEWQRTDRAIRELLKDGITPDEAVLLERELRRVEERREK